MWKVNKYLWPIFGHILHDFFSSIFIIWCTNQKKNISVEECNASKPGIGFLIEFGFDFVPRKRLSKRNAYLIYLSNIFWSYKNKQIKSLNKVVWFTIILRITSKKWLSKLCGLCLAYYFNIHNRQWIC